MLVKFANIVALGFAALNIQQAIASPVAETETHDIARRTKSLKCGWAKSKGKDLGCLCDDAASKLDLDFDLGDVLSLLFTKPSKNYPPGCRPNCDGNGGYDCPNGKDNKGNCKDDHGCDGGSAWDNGKCCPAGTRNMGGTCCPTGCEVRGGKCHIPGPPKEDKCTGAHEEKEKKDGKCVCKYGFKREHDNAPCEKICKADDQEFDGHECKCKKDHQELVNKVCKDKCIPPKTRNTEGHCVLKCPAYSSPKGDKCECDDPKKELVDKHCEDKCPTDQMRGKDGKCYCKQDGWKPDHEKICRPQCTAPKTMLNKEHNTCECPTGTEYKGGKCLKKCTGDKKLNEHTGMCECPKGFTPAHEDKCTIECTDGKTPDATGKKCECKHPKIIDRHGKCVDVPTCTHPFELDTKTNMCKCKKGYRQEHDKCIIECPGDLKPNDKNMCACPHGKVPKEHNPNQCVDPAPVCTHPFELKNNKCKCKKGYRQEHDKCIIECPGDLKPNDKGDMCVCPHGKVPKEHNPNQCVDPAPVCTHPEKLGPNGKKCVCEDGFKRRNGKCEKECGSGNKWCKTKCCRDDQEEDDYGNCKCPHGKKEVEFWGKKSCQKDLLGKLLG